MKNFKEKIEFLKTISKDKYATKNNTTDITIFKIGAFLFGGIALAISLTGVVITASPIWATLAGSVALLFGVKLKKFYKYDKLLTQENDYMMEIKEFLTTHVKADVMKSDSPVEKAIIYESMIYAYQQTLLEIDANKKLLATGDHSNRIYQQHHNLQVLEGSKQNLAAFINYYKKYQTLSYDLIEDTIKPKDNCKNATDFMTCKYKGQASESYLRVFAQRHGIELAYLAEHKVSKVETLEQTPEKPSEQPEIFKTLNNNMALIESEYVTLFTMEEKLQFDTIKTKSYPEMVELYEKVKNFSNKAFVEEAIDKSVVLITAELESLRMGVEERILRDAQIITQQHKKMKIGR